MFGDRLIKEDSNYFIEVYNKVEHETIKSKLEEINSYFKKFGFKTSLDIKLNENKRDEIQKEIEQMKTSWHCQIKQTHSKCLKCC